MIPVPPDIMARFQDFLDRKPVKSDFRHIRKNGFDFTGILAKNIIIRSQNMKASVILSKSSVRKNRKIIKSNKLRMPFLCIMKIVKERPSVAEHVKIRKNTSVKKAEIFPYNDTTVFAALGEKRSNAVQAGPVDVPPLSDGLSGFRDQKFAGGDIENYLSRGGSKTFRIF